MYKLGLCLFIGILLTSCQVKQKQLNDDIPSSLKKELTQLNNTVIKAFLENEISTLRQHCSPEFLKSTPDLLELAKEIYFVNEPLSTPEPLHAHFVNALPKQPNSVKYNDLSINFLHAKKECYLIVNNFAGQEGAEYIWASCYSKIKDKEEWKMDFLRYGVIQLNDMDAMQFYGKSIELLNRGHFLDAALYAETLSGLYQPLPELSTYPSSLLMEKHIQKVTDTIASLYQFPMEFKEIPSQPVLWGVHLESVEGKLIPVVNYRTNTPVDDPQIIIPEIETVHRAISKVFPGFANNNSNIAYVANYGDPSSEETPIYLHFVQNGKE